MIFSVDSDGETHPGNPRRGRNFACETAGSIDGFGVVPVAAVILTNNNRRQTAGGTRHCQENRDSCAAQFHEWPPLGFEELSRRRLGKSLVYGKNGKWYDVAAFSSTSSRENQAGLNSFLEYKWAWSK